MSTSKRYKQLDSLLKYEDGYTVKELWGLLDDEVSIRTLRNDLKALQERPYNVEFANNLYRGKERLYRYKDTSFSLFANPEVVEEKQKRLLSCLEELPYNPQYEWMKLFVVEMSNGMLGEGRPVVSFDNNSELAGYEFFTPLAKAIVHRQPQRITYKPFAAEEQVVQVHPYHLRQFNGRWFLLGLRQGTDFVSNYALDRIVEIQDLCIDYVDTEIDFEEYFDDVIGVSIPRGDIENIELKVDARRYNYIRTKPLHHSQKEHKEQATEDYRYISIKVRINNELVSLLSSFGPDVEVLSPVSLRATMARRSDRLADMYGPEI